MKVTGIIFLAALMQVTASVYSQTKLLTLKVNNTPIESALKKIEKQSDFFFLYNNKQIDVSQKVDVDVSDKLIGDVLSEMLKETGINYLIKDKQIVLYSGDLRSIVDVLGETKVTYQQQKGVSGKVTDSGGQPLPGVTIVVKGTTTGTVTNTDGEYTLSGIPGDATLQFSFVGMKSQEIPIADKTTINIIMSEESTGIEEVVVVGYGTMKKSDLTGATVSLKGETMEDSPISTMEQAMQGRLSGVLVSSTSGEPGAGINIIIRGASSISGGNQPLYVIDGVPIFNNSSDLAGEFESNEGSTTQLNLMSSLNPNDIESIEVLKDASATAIYGSRGANGVIMITTKQGKIGKGRIDFDYMTSYSLIPELVSLVNAQQYATYVNEFRENTETTPIIYDGTYHGTASGDSIYFPNPGEIPGLMGEGTNWQREVMRNAKSHDFNLRFSGGDKNLRYNLSGGFLTDEGLLKNTDFTRGTLRANVNAQLNSILSINWNVTGSVISSNRTATNTLRSLTGGPERNGVIMKCFMASPVNRPDQDLFFDEVSNSNAYYGMMNPLSDLNNEYFKKNNYMTISNLDLRFNLSKSFFFTTRGGVTYIDDSQDRYWNQGTSLGYRTNGKSLYNKAKLAQFINENFLTFNEKINDHYLNVIAGVSIEQKVREQLRYGFQDYSIALQNGLYNNSYAGSMDPALPLTNKAKTTLLSGYGRLTYSYKSRYLLTFTARADGASVFAENNKWAFFPSAGLGWNFHQEEFFNSLQWLSGGKLRLSYGVSGNQAINAYQSLPSLGTYNVGFISGRVTGVTLSEPGNTDLKWETTSHLDLGLELGFFDNRYRFTFDYYKKTTEDLLQNMPVLSESGFSNFLANFGSIQNNGFEVELSTFPIRKRDIKWAIDLNYSVNRAEITDLGELNYIDYTSTILNFTDATHRLVEGGKLGDFFGLQTDGLLTAEDIANNYPTYRGAISEGDLKFVDRNDDKVISQADGTILGNAFPDFTFGINNTIEYKNFSLSFLIRGAIGQEVMNWQSFLTSFGKGDGGVPTISYFNDRWTPSNTEAYYPRAAGVGLAVSDRIVEDGSFVRLQNVTLSYKIPEKSRWLRNARIYFTGYNLFKIDNYCGYDPEVSAYGQNLLRAGIDKGTYPRTRILSFGINLGF